MKSGPTALSIPTKASMTWLEALTKPGCWTCLSYSERWILHAVSCIRLEADPTTPSYNAMNLSQEELDVSHFRIRILSANIQVVKALEPLRTWSQTLSQIPKQRPALPSASFPAGAPLAHMYSRRWVETWQKITCLLDLLGVYIRFILFVSTFKFIANCSHSNMCVSIMAWTTYHNGGRIMAWT